MISSHDDVGCLKQTILKDGFGVDSQLIEFWSGGQDFNIVVIGYFQSQLLKNLPFQSFNRSGEVDVHINSSCPLGEEWLNFQSDIFSQVLIGCMNDNFSSIQLHSHNVNWGLPFLLLIFINFLLSLWFLLRSLRNFPLALRYLSLAIFGKAPGYRIKQARIKIQRFFPLQLVSILYCDGVKVSAVKQGSISDILHKYDVVGLESDKGHVILKDYNLINCYDRIRISFVISSPIIMCLGSQRLKKQRQCRKLSVFITFKTFKAQIIKMNPIDDNSPQAINETYKIWKKNVPFLYNVLHVYELPSCSQTLDWIPERQIHDSWQVNKLVLGSNSITKNYIMVIDVKLPTQDSLVDYTAYKEINSGDSNIGTMGQQPLKQAQFYPQNGQIMRVRVFKGDNNSLLAACVGGQNYQYFVYDISQDPELAEKKKIVLDAHECQGFGLDWHPTQENLLTTGAFDKKMCLWNLKAKGATNTIKPERVFEHSASIQDVKWCRKDHNLIGTASQDRQISIWDIREESNQKPALSKAGHKGEVYTLDFCHHSPYLLLTGGDDSDINLWDTRNMQRTLQSFIGHNDAVTSVKWSSDNPYTFTSASFDRRVAVWDLRGFKENQSENSNQELLFIHGGHRSKVVDFCYNPENTVCASTEEANILHVWQMNDKISEGKGQ